jgi:thiol:disulfide interchange protein
MLKKLMLGLMGALVLGRAGAADLNWPADFPHALAQAKAEKKWVFLDFTGSDWCEPCQLLAGKILSRPEFVAYAITNLELVEVDFPMKKSQPEALKAANKALAEKFNVEAYPTLIAVKPDGTVAWRMDGFLPSLLTDGPKALIAQIEGARKPN